jgi:hypothetical protein
MLVGNAAVLAGKVHHHGHTVEGVAHYLGKKPGYFVLEETKYPKTFVLRVGRKIEVGKRRSHKE